MTSVALVSAAGVFAQTRPAPRTMAVDEIRAGMRGYGLTVFQGVRPERFDVEIVDVLHNARPRMDMILVRPTHPTIERTGTVAGMSGSPIYINDRLIGAYAYGWDFGREAIAGVTPISNMLAELQRVRRAPPGVIPGSQVPLPITVPEPSGGGGGRDRARRRGSLDTLGSQMQLARAPVTTAFGQMVPLSVPVSVAGMSEGAVRYLTQAFEPFGVVPLQGSGSGRRDRNTAPPAGNPTHYENGGSVSVALVSGDISAIATGTVTLVQGDDVLAFGHPMMGLGEVSLPTTLSRVAWIMSTLRRSFKMAEPLADLGALQQDRPFTIIVNERAPAPTVPVRMHVLGNASAPYNDWNLRVSYHRSLFPRLVAAAVGTVLETTAGDNADVAWVVRSEVLTHDHGTLQFVDHGASGEGTGSLQAGSLGFADAIDRLADNPFEQVRVDRVDVNIELRWARDFRYIRTVSLSRAEADPGETVQVLVSLGQYGSAPIVQSIPLLVPREVAGRDVEIEVSAGGETVADLAEPESIDDLIRNVTTSFPEDSLVVSMRMPGQGVFVRGRAVPNLPGSAFDALRPAASTESGDPFLNVRRTIVPVGRTVLGRDRVRLHVREVRQ